MLLKGWLPVCINWDSEASKISKFFYLRKKRSFKLKVEDKHRIIENKLALLIKYYHMVNNKIPGRKY